MTQAIFWLIRDSQCHYYNPGRRSRQSPFITRQFLLTCGNRPDEIGLTAITTAVVMIVAISDSENARAQPLLRLSDTMVGIAVGMT